MVSANRGFEQLGPDWQVLQTISRELQHTLNGDPR